MRSFADQFEREFIENTSHFLWKGDGIPDPDVITRTASLTVRRERLSDATVQWLPKIYLSVYVSPSKSVSLGDDGKQQLMGRTILAYWTWLDTLRLMREMLRIQHMRSFSEFYGIAKGNIPRKLPFVEKDKREYRKIESTLVAPVPITYRDAKAWMAQRGV